MRCAAVFSPTQGKQGALAPWTDPKSPGPPACSPPAPRPPTCLRKRSRASFPSSKCLRPHPPPYSPRAAISGSPNISSKWPSEPRPRKRLWERVMAGKRSLWRPFSSHAGFDLQPRPAPDPAPRTGPCPAPAPTHMPAALSLSAVPWRSLPCVTLST